MSHQPSKIVQDLSNKLYADVWEKVNAMNTLADMADCDRTEIYLSTILALTKTMFLLSLYNAVDKSALKNIVNRLPSVIGLDLQHCLNTMSDEVFEARWPRKEQKQ